MLPRLIISVFSFYLSVICLYAVDLEENKHVRIKRSDIDLQTCLDNFNIHKDKIIRTQDSQNMGAKYLNEIDLGSRDECLRLCCETENCDVFVFEEKNSGSCYLFHCGPPEDFKCKFTHHVNYSSAILAVNRHLPDLENQIKLTKHEQDLNKLRKTDIDTEEILKVVQPEISGTTPSTTTVPKLVGAKEVIPQMINTKQKIQEDREDTERKCSRFQFECHSTRECIAIYNACDGIPQCADGSDEAPELGCPPQDGVAAPVLTTAPPQQAISAGALASNQQSKNQALQEGTQYDNNENHQKMPPIVQQMNQQLYRSPVSQHNNPPAVVRPEQSDFIRPINDPRNYPNTQMHYEAQQLHPYAPQSQQWVSPQLAGQIQYNDPVGLKLNNNVQDGTRDSRIFNHKENGLQVPDSVGNNIIDNGDGRMQQYIPPGIINNVPIRNDYASKLTNYYDHYRQPIQEENWPVDTYGYNSQNLPDKPKPQTNTYSTGASKKLNTKPEDNPKVIQDQMAHDLKHSKENMEHGNSGTKIKIEKHVSHIHEQYPDVVAYKMIDATDTQDGLAQTPRSAILTLTLGLIITCLMAILIGCRLKVVRRRMKRGGKSYAHDADYLVNGMYL